MHPVCIGILRKTKNVKFLLQINCKNVFAKLVQSVSLCHRLSKKSKNFQSLTTESCSKQRFSWLQEKIGIQAVRPNGKAIAI